MRGVGSPLRTVLGALGALVLVAGFTAGAAVASAAVAGADGAADPGALYVWNGSTPGSPLGRCAHPDYSTIGAAVAASAPGGRVVVCPGTYREDVVIQKPLDLVGLFATIDASGLPGAPIGSILGQAPYNGITIESSHVTVRGFIVTGAQGEGILAANPNPVAGPVVGGMQLYTGTPLTDVTIESNIVKGNDTGATNPNTAYGFCKGSGNVPGDCGEGIHLLSVADSQVVRNQSLDNAGGILLTDEFGPTHGNLVGGNYVAHNSADCGITLPSHNAGFNPTTKTYQPSFAGVYDNRVAFNIAVDNGVKGFGAGIGIFAAFPGAASYDNQVVGNFAQGNGLGGVSVHSHAPDANVDGNDISFNLLGTNNVDRSDGSDSTPTDDQTTGIVLWSAATPYHFRVAGNRIFHNTYGIWLTPATISVSGIATNQYFGVKVPVFDAS